MKVTKLAVAVVILLGVIFTPFSVQAADTVSDASVSFKPGAFIFEEAPSIDFGKQQLKAKTYDYQAKAVSDSALLADARGSLSGWSVRANLTTFVSEAGADDLNGSVMIITPSTPIAVGSFAEVPSGSPSKVEIIPGDGIDHTLWVAKQGEGAGRWNMGLKADNVVLRVPGHSATIGEHKAKMRWTVLDAPG